MPNIEINGRSIHYQDVGQGEETLVFSHGFLMNHQMYRHQIDALSKRFRVISFDHRGHGDSDPCRQPYELADLVSDAEQLIEKLVGGPVHFAGMSTGGFVGLRLLLKRPDLIKKLVLIDTSARPEPTAKLREFKFLLFMLKLLGLRPLVGQAMKNLFAKEFLTDPARKTERQYWKTYMGGLDKRSIHAFGKAIFFRGDVLEDIRRLSSYPETLIVVGEEDTPTPVHEAQAMNKAIPGSILKTVKKSGHSSPVEAPAVVTEAMERFL
ncbi:alpha/beta fold hydrolase [Ruegeria jejuensis]|uniref:alpha/beta fold hydrolase n=1 Tax=Ruegeria jejuensis TaxID=3233338 RepID=UPI00355C089E